MMESLNQIAQAQDRLAGSQQGGQSPVEEKIKRETQAATQQLSVMENIHTRFAALQQMGVQAYEKRLQAAEATAKREAEIEKQRQEALDSYNQALKAVDRARADKDANKRDAERLKEIEAARKSFFEAQIKLDALEVQSRTRKANALLKLSDQEIAAEEKRQSALAQRDNKQVAREVAEYERLVISMGGVEAQAIKVARAEAILDREVRKGNISKAQAGDKIEAYRRQLKEADATTRTARQGLQELVGSFAVLGFGPLSGVGSRIIAFNRVLKVTTDQANLLKKAMLGLTTVFLAIQAGIGIFNFFRNIAAEIDKAQKAADRLGVTLQEYQALDFVAQRSGLDGIEQVLVRLNRAIGDTARATGEAQAAFNDLGVNVRELRNLDPIDQLAAIADAYRELGDAQKGLSIASAIFGARQARAINILLQRGEGIKEIIEDAKRLGIVFEGSGRQAEEITDRLLEMDLMMKNLKLTLANELFPAFLQFAVLLQRELGGAISGVLSLFGILTTSVLKVKFDRLNKEILTAKKTVDDVRASFAAGDVLISKRSVDAAIANLERLETAKQVVATSIVARSVTEPEQAEGLLRAIQETRKRLYATQSTDIEFADDEYEELLEMLEESEELLKRNIKWWAIFGRTGGDAVNEASKRILNLVEKLRKMDREQVRSFRAIESMYSGASRISLTEVLRFDEATKEAADFIGEIAKLEDEINDLNDLQDFARRTFQDEQGNTLLGVNPDDLKTEEQAVKALVEALAGFINRMKQTNELENFLTSLTNQRDEYQQQLWIVQSLGDDHEILTAKLEREEQARRILGGTIDDQTQAMIDQLEILERDLVREERLKEFGQRLEDGIKDPIERALAGGIDSFEDFFDAILDSWRATVAEMLAEQIFRPENFGFGSRGGIGGFFNALGFGFGNAITPRQKALETSIHAGAIGSVKTAFNTSIFGDMQKTGVTPIFTSSAVFDDIRADLGIPTEGGPKLDTSGGGFAESSAFAGILGAIALGGISYLAGQNKPYDIEASGAARVGANVAVTGATLAASFALIGCAAEVAGITGALGGLASGLAALAPYTLGLGLLAGLGIFLYGELVTPPRDIELNLRTKASEADFTGPAYQSVERGAIRESPFGIIGLQVQSGPGDAAELQFQQDFIDSIQRLDKIIARTLTQPEIERVTAVLQTATTGTKLTERAINDLLDRYNQTGIYAPGYVPPTQPNTIPIGPGQGIRWRDSKGYLRESDGSYVEDKYGSYDWRKPWTQADRDALSALISEAPQFEPGNIWSELTRDPTNDIGAVVARRVDLALAAVGIDAGYFGVSLAQTGGFLPPDYYEKISELFRVRQEFIRNLDTLAGEPISTARKSLQDLNDQFYEMSAVAEALGFEIEELENRLAHGIEVLELTYTFGIDQAMFSFSNSFINTLEAIRDQADVAVRNAIDLGLSVEPALELNLARVIDALDQFIGPITNVLEAIQIDRAAPLETLEILEQRFIAALAASDPGETAQAATAYIQKLEQTFGRTEEYFAASAAVEEKLVEFNERMETYAAAQVDLVQQQTELLREGNLTRADQLQQIIDLWRTLASASTIPEGWYEAFGELPPASTTPEDLFSDTSPFTTTIYTAAESFTTLAEGLGTQFQEQVSISQQQLNVAEVGFSTLSQLLESVVEELRALRSDSEDTAGLIELAKAKKATA